MGESHLAIHDRCGTNLVVTGLLTATAALIASGRRGRDGFQAAVTAATMAGFASLPAGRWIQRNLTTDSDVGNLRVAGVRQSFRGGRPYFKVFLAEDAPA
jgi:hypothetical protein